MGKSTKKSKRSTGNSDSTDHYSVVDQSLNGDKTREDYDSEALRSFDFKRLRIKSNLDELNDNDDDVNDCSSVVELIQLYGAVKAPVDAFNHVLVQSKHFFKFYNGYYLNEKNLLLSPSKAEPINSKFYKFEYIFNQNRYCLVKIRNLYDRLFQLKFIASNSSSSNNVNDSFANRNDGDDSTLNRSCLERKSIDKERKSIENESNANIDPEFTRRQAFLNRFYYFTLPNETNSDYESKISLVNKHLRPIGHCKKLNYHYELPDCDCLKNMSIFFESLPEHNLRSEESDDFDLFDYLSLSSAEQSPSYQIYKENTFCELQDDKDPCKVNIVRIKRNVAGLLSIECIYPTRCDISWLFYLDFRLHPLGWAKINNFAYIEHEIDYVINTNSHLKHLLIQASIETDQSVPKYPLILNDHESCNRHEFKVNYLMECLYDNRFYAAKCVEIINEYYFKVEIDAFVNSECTERKKVCLIIHKNSRDNKRNNLYNKLFPCKWCSRNNLNLIAPVDWSNENKDFDWDVYLNQINNNGSNSYICLTDTSLFEWSTNLSELSEKFRLGMYLEYFDLKESKMAIGQIKAQISHLLFINLIGREGLIIESCDSFYLLPVGWSEMNNFYDNPSAEWLKFYSQIKTWFSNRQSKHDNEHSLCERIYLNLDCNLGPYFSRHKLETLPKEFGPGPLWLLLANVIQMLISNSLKPTKLIKLVQTNKKNAHFLSKEKSNEYKTIRLKAREREKYIFKDAEICTKYSQFNEFISNICYKFKCCTKFITLDRTPKSLVYDSLCKNIVCCLDCSLNYLKASSKNEEEKEIKQVVILNQKQLKPSSIHPKPINRTIKQIKRTQIEINSPIKTRLNVKQILLFKKFKQQHDQKVQEKKTEANKAKEKINKDLKKLIPTPQKYKSISVTSKSNSNESQATDKKQHKYKKINCKLIQKTSLPNKTKKYDLKSKKEKKEEVKLNKPKKANKSLQFESLNQTTESAKPSNLSLTTKSPSTSLTDEFKNLKTTFTSPTNLTESKLKSNPINWTIADVCNYLVEKKFDQSIIDTIQEHEIDGQSFLMLTLPTIQNFMNLKFGPAIKLSYLVDSLKLAIKQEGF